MTIPDRDRTGLVCEEWDPSNQSDNEIISTAAVFACDALADIFCSLWGSQIEAAPVYLEA